MHPRIILCSSLITAAIAAPALATAAPSTALSLNPAEYTVYSFSALSSGKNSDGAGPMGRIVIGADGSYYGATFQGGTGGSGTVFRIAPDGSFTTLHNFAGSDGTPSGSLMMAGDGNLYGATTTGGSSGNGSIFRITPSGSYTLLHSFGASDSNGHNADGTYVWGALVQGNDGNLYGNARFGGANGYGTVFSMSTDGSRFGVLHQFAYTTDGGTPFQGLTIGSDGNFYGTTDVTAFKITPGGVFTTLHSFAAADGLAESGLVRGLDNNFYGVTDGAPNLPGTSGIFYRLTPDGTYTALGSLDAPTYIKSNFEGLQVGPNVDGLTLSYALTLGPDGNFYGTGQTGGAVRYGTVFKVTPDGTFTNLHSFNNKTDAKGHLHAYAPDSSISFDANGNLIGAGQVGGTNKAGAIYKIVPNSTLSANLTISPTVLSAGQNATFTWSSTGATNCAFIGTVIKYGVLPTSGSVSHAGPASGKKMVTGIQCKDSSGGLANSTASVSTN